MRIDLFDTTLEFKNELSESYAWNIGEIISGTYSARLQFFDGTIMVFEVVEQFFLRSEGSFTNGIYSEKPAYYP